MLGVSIATIRRDLNELEARGLLKRTHGGAAIINQVTRDYMTPIREGTNAEEKSPHWSSRRRNSSSDGDAVIIDSGTTTLQAAKRLAARRIPDLRHQRHSTSLAAADGRAGRAISISSAVNIIDLNRSHGRPDGGRCGRGVSASTRQS
jgi:DeoR/GlpR family transcriptional regulator of sugar metabolism